MHPPHDGDRGAALGLATLLPQLQRAYQTDPERLAAQATRVVAELTRAQTSAHDRELPGPATLRSAVAELTASFDHE